MTPETYEVEAMEATALLPYDTDVESAKRYGRAARSPRTRIEYARDWSHFAHYCEHAGLAVLPAAPQTVAAYLASLAGRLDRPLKATTIQRRAAAIAFRHRQHGHAPPTAHPLVADVLAGITREHGVAPQRKSALTIELLREALAAIDDGTLRGVRNRAILLLGFAAALRRSEIVALNLDDLVFDHRGLTLHIRSSKTDQEGRGETIAIPLVPELAVCAVAALRRWIEEARLEFGPLFRSFALPRGRNASLVLQDCRLSDRDIARIVQQAVIAAGLEGDFAAHSLRAGFITSAAVRGVAEVNIQRVSRHKSTAVLRAYVRHATRFDEAPLSEILRTGVRSQNSNGIPCKETGKKTGCWVRALERDIEVVEHSRK
jgi:integrase